MNPMNPINPMKKGELILCAPRGFCAGVERAIEIVVLALKKYGAPVYVRHEIVHNRYVVEGLERRGAVFVENLDEIPDTNQPIIFSAHGVPKSVPMEAERRNLFYLDATCPLVSKVHKQALSHHRKGRHVILVGHRDHPETIGTTGQLPPQSVSLIETLEDAERFEPTPENPKLGYVTKTTLSVDDTKAILERLAERFPDLAAPAAESICYATTNRQEAVKKIAEKIDVFLIVGAPNSSNSKRLVEVAKRAGAKSAFLVQSKDDILWDAFKGRDADWTIGLSAGASAPEILVREIIDAFKERFELEVHLADHIRESEEFSVMRELRTVPLAPEDMAFLNG